MESSMQDAEQELRLKLYVGLWAIAVVMFIWLQVAA